MVLLATRTKRTPNNEHNPHPATSLIHKHPVSMGTHQPMNPLPVASLNKANYPERLTEDTWYITELLCAGGTLCVCVCLRRCAYRCVCVCVFHIPKRAESVMKSLCLS